MSTGATEEAACDKAMVSACILATFSTALIKVGWQPTVVKPFGHSFLISNLRSSDALPPRAATTRAATTACILETFSTVRLKVRLQPTEVYPLRRRLSFCQINSCQSVSKKNHECVHFGIVYQYTNGFITSSNAEFSKLLTQPRIMQSLAHQAHSSPVRKRQYSVVYFFFFPKAAPPMSSRFLIPPKQGEQRPISTHFPLSWINLQFIQ